MNLRTLVASALVLAAPAVASAQPGGYGAPPPAYVQQLPGGFHDRAGHLTLGVSLGLGGMKAESGPIDCGTCDYNPITVGVAGHIGGMLNHRLALMLELQANAQTIDENRFGETTTLVQMAAMFAAQYWVTPQLWVKGGIGGAHLQAQYDDFYGPLGEEPISDGVAVLGAVGYEILSARRYSVDLQGRLFVGSYDKLDDQITSGTIGIGMNWF
jgi:hypothetical protein